MTTTEMETGTDQLWNCVRQGRAPTQQVGNPVPVGRSLVSVGGCLFTVLKKVVGGRREKQNKECPHYLHNIKIQVLPAKLATSLDIWCGSLGLCHRGVGLQGERESSPEVSLQNNAQRATFCRCFKRRYSTEQPLPLQPKRLSLWHREKTAPHPPSGTAEPKSGLGARGCPGGGETSHSPKWHPGPQKGHKYRGEGEGSCKKSRGLQPVPSCTQRESAPPPAFLSEPCTPSACSGGLGRKRSPPGEGRGRPQ